MLKLLSLLAALTFFIPFAADAAPPTSDLPGGIDLDELGKQHAKKDNKSKKSKKSKKNAEPETPPPPPPDGDADGVIDADDKCPEEPEDIDLFEDEDGCPDTDNDGDAIADTDDDCPDKAENVDGWDDDDGCPEEPAAIKPFMISATLMDGTKIAGKVIGIAAVDEDEADSAPHEPTTLSIVVNDEQEFDTDWSNVKSLTSEKVVFTDAVDCYSEGVQELGDDAATWECTLKHPTVVKLAKSEHKGTHRLLDRKMQRMDFKLDEIECEGDSCEAIEETKTLPLYLYRLIAIEKSDDEYEAVTKLQTRLREMQQLQIKTATLEPLPEAAPAGE